MSDDIVDRLNGATIYKNAESRTDAGALMREAAAEITTLRAALAEREWKRMETAPKDGTLILATGFNWNDPTIGRHYVAVRFEYGGWFSDSEWDGSQMEYLTHWQPLPAAPEGAP